MTGSVDRRATGNEKFRERFAANQSPKRLLKNSGMENCESFCLLVSYAGYRRDEIAGPYPAADEQRSQKTKWPQPGGSANSHTRQSRKFKIQKTPGFSVVGFLTVS